jgi:hypothetical protein
MALKTVGKIGFPVLYAAQNLGKGMVGGTGIVERDGAA